MESSVDTPVSTSQAANKAVNGAAYTKKSRRPRFYCGQEADKGMMKFLEKLVDSQDFPMGQNAIMEALKKGFSSATQEMLGRYNTTCANYVMDKEIPLEKRIRLAFILKVKICPDFEQEMTEHGSVTLNGSRNLIVFNSFYPKVIPTCSVYERDMSMTYIGENRVHPPPTYMTIGERRKYSSSANQQQTEERGEEENRSFSMPQKDTPASLAQIAVNNLHDSQEEQNLLSNDAIGISQEWVHKFVMPVLKTGDLQSSNQPSSSIAAQLTTPKAINTTTIENAFRKRGIEETPKENGFKKRKFSRLPAPQINAYYFLYGIISWLDDFNNFVLNEFREKLMAIVGPRAQELNAKRMNLSVVKRNMEFIIDTVKNQRKRDEKELDIEDTISLKTFFEKLEEFTISFNYFSPIFGELIREFRDFDDTEVKISTKLIVYSLSFLITENDLF
uniref:SPK domain-containing protein n=1 Tax=Caenorhabditis tropicalis TaxID=1561998 RepID=A0A1I7U671_9PELO